MPSAAPLRTACLRLRVAASRRRRESLTRAHRPFRRSLPSSFTHRMPLLTSPVHPWAQHLTIPPRSRPPNTALPPPSSRSPSLPPHPSSFSSAPISPIGAACCSVFSLIAVIFLCFVGTLLTVQPEFIEGIEDPAAGAKTVFASGEKACRSRVTHAHASWTVDCSYGAPFQCLRRSMRAAPRHSYMVQAVSTPLDFLSRPLRYPSLATPAPLPGTLPPPLSDFLAPHLTHTLPRLPRLPPLPNVSYNEPA